MANIQIYQLDNAGDNISNSAFVATDIENPDVSERAEVPYLTKKVSLTAMEQQMLKDTQYTTDLQTDSKTIFGAINELKEGGGGNADKVELTQAEYDELSEEEKHNGKLYFITDGQAGGGGSVDFVEEAIPDIPTRELPYYPSGEYSGLNTTNKHIVGAINEVNTNKADSFMKGSLSSGTDLNDIKDIGVYWVPRGGITNAPATAYGVLEVLKATSTSNIIQRFTQYGDNNTATQYDTYIREFTNGQWYQWKQTINAIKKTVSPTTNQYVSPFTHYAEIDARTDIGSKEVIGVLLTTASTTNPLSYNYNGGYIRVYAMKTDSVTVSIICR